MLGLKPCATTPGYKLSFQKLYSPVTGGRTLKFHTEHPAIISTQGHLPWLGHRYTHMDGHGWTLSPSNGCGPYNPTASWHDQLGPLPTSLIQMQSTSTLFLLVTPAESTAWSTRTSPPYQSTLGCSEGKPAPRALVVDYKNLSEFLLKLGPPFPKK